MGNTRRNNNLIKNNKGQAVLEYVFLTFMILVVLLAIIIAISRSTQKFAQNYFGEYFQCLLEVGELPTLGVDGDSGTECDDSFEPFTLADGWKSKDSDTGNASNTEDDKNENSKKEDADKKSSYDSASSGASESGGSSTSSGTFESSFGSRSPKIPLSNADKRGSSKSSSDDLGNTSAKNNFEQPEEFGENGSGRSEYVPIYGGVDEEKKKEGSDVVKADSTKDPEQALRGRRVPANVKPEEGKVKEDEGVTLPDFIKYLIIAAIILIILIFFGGQVMQYQKSQD